MSRRERHLGDPTWYRISYSLAVQLLDAPASGTHGGRAKASPVSGPAAAEQRAEQLLVKVRQQLWGAGWRQVGRRPPLWRRRKLRSRRWPPRDSEIRDERVADFLDRTVEPATIVLLWSTRLMQGRRLDFLSRPAPRALWRVSAPPRPRGGGTPHTRERAYEAYLLQLLSRPPRRSVVRRSLRWIGFALEPGRHVSYRVRYNLACLLARAAVREEGEAQAQLLAMSVDQLATSFTDLEGPARDLLARWAWSDPGLRGARELLREDFIRIVGAPPSTKEPEPPPPRSRRSWLEPTVSRRRRRSSG